MLLPSGNCTEGFKIKGKGCEACPIQTYQDEIWQTDCKKCPDKNGQKTSTKYKNSTSLDDCISKYYIYDHDQAVLSHKCCHLSGSTVT